MELSDNDPDFEGAQLFAERCSGCHTLSAAGTQGTANRSERVQGPDLDLRTETVEDLIAGSQSGQPVLTRGCRAESVELERSIEPRR